MPATLFPFVAPRLSRRDSDSSSSAAAAAALTVEVEYLFHTKTHRSDTEERRAHKRHASEVARKDEGTFEWEYSKPVHRWTEHDVLNVIDMIWEQMPRADSNSEHLHNYWTLPDDPFRDGRALQHIEFTVLSHGEQLIWFSTGSGYSARIRLSACIPASAIVPLALDRLRGVTASINLDVREARRAARQGGAR
jgi:hypothetical protein